MPFRLCLPLMLMLLHLSLLHAEDDAELTTFREAVKASRELRKSKNIAGALELARQAHGLAENDNQRASAFRLIADQQAALDEYQSALDTLREADALAGVRPDLRRRNQLHRINLAIRGDLFPQAKAAIEAIGVEPDLDLQTQVSLLNLKAQLAWQQDHDRDQAIAHYQAILELPEIDQTNVGLAHLRIGQMYHGKKEYSAARTSFALVLENQAMPGWASAAAQLGIGHTYYMEKDIALARDAYTAVTTMEDIPAGFVRNATRQLERLPEPEAGQ